MFFVLKLNDFFSDCIIFLYNLINIKPHDYFRYVFIYKGNAIWDLIVNKKIEKCSFEPAEARLSPIH